LPGLSRHRYDLVLLRRSEPKLRCLQWHRYGAVHNGSDLHRLWRLQAEADMTVGELIEELKKQPPDMKVVSGTYCDEVAEVESVWTVDWQSKKVLSI
jgi:hypothetical protein